MNSITLKPRMSEKTYALSTHRVYVFDVDKSINKHEIVKAVEWTYPVKVTEIRTIIPKRKTKRLYRNKKYEIGKFCRSVQNRG